MTGAVSHARGPAIPRVLSIAGTDPTGGAGIQADLKSIAANGGYGMAVATALVAQNTTGVRSIHVPPVAFLTEQLLAVSDDVTIDAVKIGMLFDAAIITAVADWLAATRPPIVVLDPVMIAASGDRLLSEDAAQALRALLPVVDLVTPNLPELAALLDAPTAGSWEHAVEQAQALARTHGVQVLVKGGHLDGAEAPDALIDATGATALQLSTPRIATRNTHGTGCSLSAAVATLRANGTAWAPAVRQAKAWLTESIEAADALGVGHGSGPVSHFAGLWRRGGRGPESAEQIGVQWWDAIAPIRTGIDDSAFIAGLADGSLSRDAFAWYLTQDAHYLRDYARVLAQASRLAPTAAEQGFWAGSAHGAIETELALHREWLSPGALATTEPSAVTTGYVNHLLATAARGDYDELVAAALPCFWIYTDVGTRLSEHATPQHPYAAWLQTYGDPAFRALSDRAVAIVTARASGADGSTQLRMRAAFEASAAHELSFFAAPLERTERA